jgi:hypothetical protein
MLADLTLSKRAFWDVDFESLDFQQHKAFIIEKAYDRGSWKDMKWCVNEYGEEEVKNALKNARSLRHEVVRLTSVLFDIPEIEFRCCKLRGQNLLK